MMKTDLTRRRGLAALASMLALVVSLPAAGFAGPATQNAYQGKPAPRKPARPASDKIVVGTCIPGEPGFDPVKCHKEITDD